MPSRLGTGRGGGAGRPVSWRRVWNATGSRCRLDLCLESAFEERPDALETAALLRSAKGEHCGQPVLLPALTAPLEAHGDERLTSSLGDAAGDGKARLPQRAISCRAAMAPTPQIAMVRRNSTPT